MNHAELTRAWVVAIEAAHRAGALMARQVHRTKVIKVSSQHDIKLELDERCQRLIEAHLSRHFPAVSILGEEGVLGDPESEYRWVVDPIDGTVNFTYGLPQACVSIALQGRKRLAAKPPAKNSVSDADYQTLVGVVYDPFRAETFNAIRGRRAEVNNRRLRVSQRTKLDEAILSIGFAKHRKSLELMLPVFTQLVHRVRKIRIMGAAALDMVYVAGGRMDAYVESGLRLWDIAAGGLILECAGGDFRRQAIAGPPHSYAVVASNGQLEASLRNVTRKVLPKTPRAL